MKNLKLFVAPLLGAALLTACGPKQVDVKTFKEKVKDNYNIANISEKYKGKKMHITGSVDTSNVDEEYKITGAKEDEAGGLAGFTFESGEVPEIPVPFTILNTTVVETIEKIGEGVKVNLFISGDYIIDMSGEQDGEKGSAKFVFNGDLAISHIEGEGNVIGTGSTNLKLDFKYE